MVVVAIMAVLAAAAVVVVLLKLFHPSASQLARITPSLLEMVAQLYL